MALTFPSIHVKLIDSVHGLKGPVGLQGDPMYVVNTAGFFWRRNRRGLRAKAHFGENSSPRILAKVLMCMGSPNEREGCLCCVIEPSRHDSDTEEGDEKGEFCKPTPSNAHSMDRGKRQGD